MVYVTIRIVNSPIPGYYANIGEILKVRNDSGKEHWAAMDDMIAFHGADWMGDWLGNSEAEIIGKIVRAFFACGWTAEVNVSE